MRITWGLGARLQARQGGRTIVRATTRAVTLGVGLGALAISALAVPAHAQTMQAFDLLQFQVPTGTREDEPGLVVYKHVQGRTFCVFGVYRSGASVGDAVADYRAEWADVGRARNAPNSPPAPRSSAAPNGWTRVEGHAQEQLAGTGRYEVRHIVFSGHGLRTSALAMFNDARTCAADAFVANLVPLAPTAVAPSAAAASPPGINHSPIASAAPLPAPPANPAPPPAGRLPTGHTPDLFPGSPGWLPSGRGVPIPVARVIDGKPQGLWWYPQMQGSRMAAVSVVFLADGTTARRPRPGAGHLVDLEAQRAQRGSTGVGHFSVAGGKLSHTYDTFSGDGTFSHGSDAEGPWFNVGAQRYRPLVAPVVQQLVGTWTTPGGKYVFRADGSFESGHMGNNQEWGVGARGTWQLDGYLIAIQPHGTPGWITTVGATGTNLLVIGNSVYSRP
jgi:hypothetical protein